MFGNTDLCKSELLAFADEKGTFQVHPTGAEGTSDQQQPCV